MKIRNTLLGLFAVLLLIAGISCTKSGIEVPEASIASTELAPNTVARVHWLGKKRLGVMASAYYVTRLWHLPETRRLESQTLDKLSVAPWLLLHGKQAIQSAPAALVRPLLEDVIQEECYFEMRARTDQAVESVFAVRLDETRAGVWRTNLVAATAGLVGVQTMELTDEGRGWTLNRPGSSSRIELVRAGGWTIVGAADKTNSLLTEIAARVRRPRKFAVAEETNWLSAQVDMQRFPWRNPLVNAVKASSISLSISGDGGNVLAEARMRFAEPLNMELDTWRIPAPLVRGPLVSFTAARGVATQLSSWNVWSNLHLGNPPNQIFMWAEGTNAFQTYAAVPVPDAALKLESLTQLLFERTNPWLQKNGLVNFERVPGMQVIVWGNNPDIRPFVQSVGAHGEWLLSGLMPGSGGGTETSILSNIVKVLSGSTNLAAFDWENSQARMGSILEIGAFIRLISRRTPFPLDSPSGHCLRVITPRLGMTETEVRITGPKEIIVNRKGTTGFTAVELQLMADWLESSQFPRNLHLMNIQPEPMPSVSPP